MKTKFIAIEGLDGSGKETQTNLLYEKLKKRQNNVLKLSFPDYKSKSSDLVKMYLSGEISQNADEINAYAASSFYSADRYISFIKNWKTQYEAGSVILTDRYTTSNQIYQTAKLQKKSWKEFIEWIEDFEYKKLSLPSPDLVIFLNVPVEISQQLMLKRYSGNEAKKDIYESNVEFLKKCHSAAMYCAEKLNWQVVNCAKNNKIKTIDEIHNSVIEIIDRFLEIK